jgi:hypothetical protein
MKLIPFLALVALAISNAVADPDPKRTITAHVVALDQPWMWNRLGASQPQGMIYALKRDVVSLDTPIDENGNDVISEPLPLKPGHVRLRTGKRPRPLVLRANVGDILEVHFTNLLAEDPGLPVSYIQPATRIAGFHVQGLELVGSIDSSASWVGANPGATGSLAKPGESKIYKYYARGEGVFMAYTQYDHTNGQLDSGLFGSVTVQPEDAEWYRSQVTREQFNLATKGAAPNGLPLIDYNAVFPHGHPQAGYPVLNFLHKNEIIHSDLTAIITGPNAGRFPANHPSPTFRKNPAYPDRHQPYREFVQHYHNFAAIQAFPEFNDPALAGPFAAGADAFGINYGSAGIGAEIIANRIGVGPMGRADAVDLKFEEFFLSSWAVGDPAMVVDVPANVKNVAVSNPAKGLQVNGDKLSTATGPAGEPVDLGPKATKVFYPDDPSNVYHSYMRDHVKFRILNTGSGIAHVHHLHAHQWLRSPNSDNSSYLDSQFIAAGSTYTLDMVYNGSGNRNQTVGDSIFHCHLYPHFAAGMWAMWRVHDVMERGTPLDENGRPLPGSRALPDGEITLGTPIPGIVPLPTIGMAPEPAKVKLVDEARRVEVEKEPDSTYKNPGYPFFIPGISGHRAPHPPMDYAVEDDGTVLDGGLPRHIVLDGKIVREAHTRWDFSKDFVRYNTPDIKDPNRKLVDGGLKAVELPENGTEIEQAAMATHAIRSHPTFEPDGRPGTFTLNGLPPVPGAPYADPAVDDKGCSTNQTRRYKAAVIQIDVVFNKKGWHYPQQRFTTLWEDVKPTISGERAPQPFFFRSHSGDTIEFWHTNLVPNYYEMDDFQVRTPTDILGQHIHLVKFDVTSSDGGGNGFNYEDGTFGPDEVRERIDAINFMGGLHAYDPLTQGANPTVQKKLSVKPYDKTLFGEAPAYQNWNGAQTTVQRFDTDPLLNNDGFDRTLRTVFTHDHFGPSTHQQVGLYAGMLVEPAGSEWLDNETGEPMATRPDGGPTSWQAVIKNGDDSYREFAFTLQDFSLLYQADSRCKPARPKSAWFSSDAAFTASLDSGKIPPGLLQDFASAGDDLPANALEVQALVKGSEWKVGELSSAYPATARTHTIWLSTLFTVPGMSAGPVTPEIRDIFGTHGIAISSLATTTVNSAGWVISDGGQNYQVNKALEVQRLKISAPHEFESWADTVNAVNPPGFDPGNLANGAPYPQLVSSFPDAGSWSFNYRTEPLPFRIDPNPKNKEQLNPDEQQKAGDLAFAFASIPRVDADLNVQPTPGSPINPSDPAGFKFPEALTPDAQPTDPYTPLIRAYANDKVQIRTLVGAHEQAHPFQVHGVRWFYEPDYSDSGYRNVQPMALSEHYEMVFKLPTTSPLDQPFADYLYEPSSGTPGLVSGLWGLMRAYTREVDGLYPLPTNRPGSGPPQAKPNSNSIIRKFHIVAITAAQAAPGKTIIYNDRGQLIADNPKTFDPKQKLLNPYAVLYARAEDLEGDQLRPGLPVEPLILRANAGDWIEVTLENRIQHEINFSDPAQIPFGVVPLFASPITDSSELNNGNIPQALRDQFTKNDAPLSSSAKLSQVGAGIWGISDNLRDFSLKITGEEIFIFPQTALPFSYNVGLNAQLVSYDITNSDGLNVGFNPIQTVAPGESRISTWYAGIIDGENLTPVEFGAINLTPADGLIQHRLGMIGALIIEPEGSNWELTGKSRSSAIVHPEDGEPFQDLVLVFQDDAVMFSNNEPYKTDDGFAGTFHTVGAFNYRSEPMNFRYPLEIGEFDTTAAYAADLDKGVIPQPLRDEFSKKGVPITDACAVAIVIKGKEWQIADANPYTLETSTQSLELVGGVIKVRLDLVTFDASGKRQDAPYSILVNEISIADNAANSRIGGDPVTPIFTVKAGMPVRLRWLYPAGDGEEGQVLALSGHVWREEPYQKNSTVIGDNPLSVWLGTQRFVPYQPINMVLDSAGGAFATPGDYLFHILYGERIGAWGILRVVK